MNTGFIITELKLLGQGLLPAVITLNKGLNVITGPSNTGKTYIYQCINYMFGSSVKPKGITQSLMYESISMKIQTSSGEVFTIESDLKGGDFLVYSAIREPFRLARKHDPDRQDTISAFLLSLNQLEDKKVRTNAKGKTRQLSYRDIVRFLMVDEARIITDSSPITSGQYTTPTEEKSTFKLLLSGKDDSDIVEILSTGEVKYRKGKIELLTELIKSTTNELSNITDNIEPEIQIQRIDNTISQLKIDHDQLKDEFTALDIERTAYSQEISQLISKRTYNEEILIRSEILKEQYVIDAKRLNSTIEASYLLLNNPTVKENCPVCEKPLDERNVEPELSSVISACGLEIKKIGTLINEVIESESILNEENESFSAEILKLQGLLKNVSDNIEKGVSLKLETIFNQISELNGIKANLNNAVFLKDKVSSFTEQKKSILSTISTKKGGETFEDLLTSNVFELSSILYNILVECSYPSISGVTYSETNNDFVISGEDRELAGKGYRAIIYASFLIALQELVSTKNYSIGPTVLDSPLVTYRKPSAQNEGITVDLAMDFYRYLASNIKVPQVIILENEEPPIDILPLINHIVFTKKTDSGRYGFIPI